MINTPEIRINVPEERKFDIVDEVLSQARAANLDINDVDGLRVSGPDGWWLLRASNTENALVIRCESQDQEGLERLKATVVSYLSTANVPVPAF
jgi:phosphomannomutase